MAGKIPGHGKPIVAVKPKAPRTKPPGLLTHDGRRRRSASLHRSNRIASHRRRVAVRKAYSKPRI